MKRLFLTSLLSLAGLIAFAQGDSGASIKLIRNATLTIDYAGHKILVDPMFSPVGAFGSIAGVYESPMVGLPEPVESIISGVDLILLTHNHPDHFDQYAIDALDKTIRFYNQPADEAFILSQGFTNSQTLQNSVAWEGIIITRVNAQHGTGRVLQAMGEGSGYILQAQDLPSIYIIGDGIWTEEVYEIIATYRPDYIVVNSGGAAMPGFEATPIIMDELQTMSLIQESGDAKVIAVHMDVIDHCRTTREVLRNKARECNIVPDKLIIPADGETVNL